MFSCYGQIKLTKDESTLKEAGPTHSTEQPEHEQHPVRHAAGAPEPCSGHDQHRDHQPNLQAPSISQAGIERRVCNSEIIKKLPRNANLCNRYHSVYGNPGDYNTHGIVKRRLHWAESAFHTLLENFKFTVVTSSKDNSGSSTCVQSRIAITIIMLLMSVCIKMVRYNNFCDRWMYSGTMLPKKNVHTFPKMSYWEKMSLTLLQLIIINVQCSMCKGRVYIEIPR